MDKSKLSQKNIDRMYKACIRAGKVWQQVHKARQAWMDAKEKMTEDEFKFFCKGMDYAIDHDFGDFGA